jgi:putative transport protein
VQSGVRTLASGESIALVTGALSAAFGLCYSVSQVQFVLLMKLMPKLAGFDAPKEAKAFETSMRGERTAPLPGTTEAGDVTDMSIAVRAYRLAAGTIGGRTVAEIRAKAPRVSIETVRRGDKWLTPDDTLKLEAGDEVVVGAPLAAQVRVREALGPEIPDAEARSRTAIHTVDVVVGRPEAAGRPLPDLLAGLGPGLYPNALFRAGAELPLGGETTLKVGDVIRVTGTEPHIQSLGKKVGQVIRASHVNDVLTLAIGLLVGAALGAVPVPLFGVSITFGATAVLITGIIFGWLKTRHPALGGPISEGGRSLLEVLGTPRLVDGPAPAPHEPGVAHGRCGGRTPEHLVDAGGPGDLALSGPWDRLPSAAGHHDRRALGHRLFLRAVCLEIGSARVPGHSGQSSCSFH